MAEILVIDDDVELGGLLKAFLGQHGLRVKVAPDGAEGLKLLRRHKPDAVILDVMLPGSDGFEVCRRIRSESRTPIIMLTARGQVSDRVVGLELGADDYLPKPFDPRELLARIHTILRRSIPLEGGGALISGALRLDTAAQSATLKGKALHLTSTEYAILLLLMSHAGVALDRDRILGELRGGDSVFDRSVDLAISRLRKKLGSSGRDSRFIKTLWGSGYLFTGKVSHHAP